MSSDDLHREREQKIQEFQEHIEKRLNVELENLLQIRERQYFELSALYLFIFILHLYYILYFFLSYLWYQSGTEKQYWNAETKQFEKNHNNGEFGFSFLC